MSNAPCASVTGESASIPPSYSRMSAPRIALIADQITIIPATAQTAPIARTTKLNGNFDSFVQTTTASGTKEYKKPAREPPRNPTAVQIITAGQQKTAARTDKSSVLKSSVAAVAERKIPAP